MNKVVVRMSAGLANRMFQYTYGVYLSEKGYYVYYDNNYVASKWKFEDISWKAIFPSAEIKEAPQKLVAKLGGRYNAVDKVRRHFLKGFCPIIINKSPLTLVQEDELNTDKYLIGVFHNSIPAQSVQPIIREKFKFAPLEGSENLNFVDKIQNEASVAIHVRKGADYQKADYFMGTCSAEYYRRAVDYIKEQVENPVFYLFTDNPQWVRENLSDIPYILVDWNPVSGWGNHFDMQLMSMCRHNIIANSTYSWWGAFLNSNPDKIVIGPKEWFTNAYYGEESHTLSDEWIAF